MEIIEKFTPCGVNVSYMVKRIMTFVPANVTEGLNTIEILDYSPERNAFGRYFKAEKRVEIYVREIIDWQPKILKKTIIFPYLSIGITVGHELHHHVNSGTGLNSEKSAVRNAFKYISPSFGVFRPLAWIFYYFLKYTLKNTKEGFYNTALIAFEAEEYERAQKYFEKVLRKDPNSKIAIDHLGRIHLVKGDYQRAIRYFEHSLKIDKQVSLVWENIAYAYYVSERYEDSYQAYEKAYELKPTDENLKNMEMAQEKKGKG